MPYENFEFLCNLWLYRFVGTHVGVKYILLRLSLIRALVVQNFLAVDLKVYQKMDRFYYGLENKSKNERTYFYRLLSVRSEVKTTGPGADTPQLSGAALIVPQTLYLGSFLDVCSTNKKSMNK